MTHTQQEDFRRLVGVSCLIGILAYAAMAVAHCTHDVATIWPANGLLLGILLTSPRRSWGATIMLGLFANTLGGAFASYPIALCFRLAAVNAFEIGVAALLVQRFIGQACDISRPRSFLRFALAAAVLAPGLATLVNAGLSSLTRPVSAAGLVALFDAHALGIITITPVILALRQRAAGAPMDVRRLARAGGTIAILLAVTALVFSQSSYPLLFLVYPALTLAVHVGGFTGGVLGVFLVTATAIMMTALDMGPMTLVQGSTYSDRIIVLQVFAAIGGLKVLTLSAILAQRDRAEAALRTARDDLERLATTDALTGLFNRRRMDEVLDAECRRAARDRSPLSFLLLDVDRFKRFNDAYGHQAGDRCLAAVAAAVKAACRRPCDLVARYGGEEIAVVLPATNEAGAAMLADAVRTAIEGLGVPHAGNAECGGVVTASIGVATIYGPSAAYLPKALIGAADTALYDAKETGRNRVRVTALRPSVPANGNATVRERAPAMAGAC